MIQNAIWTVEEFGFDGFRIDTYKYCDEKFLNKMNAAILKEFPTITTFVEHGEIMKRECLFRGEQFQYPSNTMHLVD
jgi:hypothetical protein